MTIPAKIDKAIFDTLARSGLIDGIDNVGALVPEPLRRQENDRLCCADDGADCLWVVHEGEVGVHLADDTVVRRGPGFVVGEQALLEPAGRRSADMTIRGGPATLIRISRSAIEVHPQATRIWQNCARILSSKLAEATRQRGSILKQRRQLEELVRRHAGSRVLGGAVIPESFYEGPRREHAIVWFSDVCGFSRHAAEMPPERVATMVQQFLAPQVEAIEAADGFIDKFVGDMVMAFWIIPEGGGASECAAALDAAIRALAGVREVEFGPHRLRIRVGLHVGPVCTGNFGTATRAQYTLIGDTVNTAARLEQCKETTDGVDIGWIRTTETFFARLPAASREHLRVQAKIEAKNMGQFSIRTTAPEK